jgi:5-hydroxyisourate hydrolase
MPAQTWPGASGLRERLHRGQAILHLDETFLRRPDGKLKWMCATVSTHVLDVSRGGPRIGLPVTVHDDTGSVVGSGETDGDGRVAQLAVGLAPGRYRITWRCGPGFLTELSATVALEEDRHYHVPLLASPASAMVYLGH